ncbi:hypothetical protein WALSEDRAFT_60165 [Wallemia mellicola CBS 633.66]|uniref:Translation machinery-associated protein 16 n=1 Tax=Wallemia mellicola (strain ATCC MYA-4683 / CBS 633.66) TaxID=671144 RepID=I4YDQ0_WALMC|nr:hypothetical protein WALSEDRAFT_60165 [Wallemia mellicola CBS 633.66]EIM22092.1 hypothetical protein WALSEDRAFT_60165 [Wallemia mellicola CBS 633.66]|eukprot:XP_006957895.1 hypothetical protein WALSEDRAFT_60165 [Wallemia mellicola CBS 633.66]
MTKLTMKQIKNRQSIHPGSRKAEQVTRVNLRLNKLDKQRKVMDTEKTNKMSRYNFIASQLASIEPEPELLSLEDLHNLVELYINRDDDHYNELRATREQRDKSLQRSSGKSARESELESRKERDLQEYASGFIVPDLSDSLTMKLFKQFPCARKLSKKSKGKTQASAIGGISNNKSDANSLTPEELAEYGLDYNYLPQLNLVRIYKNDRNLKDLSQKGKNNLYNI